ncbi:MAG TPA: dihydropteroate synthase [Burkholderiaceae bacterium]|nr:dihydropteroate synthase [Burkholderiaceae bacterium]
MEQQQQPQALPLAVWQTGRFRIDLSQPRVMGIVNLTPDSFSDGGAHSGRIAGLAHCERLVAEGADILDLGGESTRPGASEVGVAQELDRLMPVLEGALKLGVPVSVDTRKPEVMRAALAAGADIINDVNALRAPGAIEAVAAHPRCGVCLMHMRGTPETMQQQATYADVVAEVVAFLRERCEALEHAGVSAERITVDPGIGFGKSPDHNLQLLQRQAELLTLGRPLLVGWSRKSTLGVITGRDAGDRLIPSIVAALIAVQRGARIVRVHDVAATVDVLRVWQRVGPARG